MGTRRLQRREVHFGLWRALALSVKLGHPVSLSSSSKHAKSGSLETSTQRPDSLLSQDLLQKGALDPISLRLAILLGSQLRDRFGVVPVGRHSPYSVVCYIVEDMYRVVVRPITSGYRNDAMRIDIGGVSICKGLFNFSQEAGLTLLQQDFESGYGEGVYQGLRYGVTGRKSSRKANPARSRERSPAATSSASTFTGRGRVRLFASCEIPARRICSRASPQGAESIDPPRRVETHGKLHSRPQLTFFDSAGHGDLGSLPSAVKWRSPPRSIVILTAFALASDSV
ncbi:hypothetical protein ABIB84_004748 [Bradyrhizobium sp. JR1.1]